MSHDPKQCHACGSFCGGGYDGKPCRKYVALANQCGHFCEACARRDDKIKELQRQLAEAYSKIQSQGEDIFFKTKEIAEAREFENAAIDSRIAMEKKLHSTETELSDERSRLEDGRAEITRSYKTLNSLRAEIHAAAMTWDNERHRLQAEIARMKDNTKND